MSFQLHPEARNEFREAVLFYGRAAERFVNAVETAIAAIILIGVTGWTVNGFGSMGVG